MASIVRLALPIHLPLRTHEKVAAFASAVVFVGQKKLNTSYLLFGKSTQELRIFPKPTYTTLASL